MKYIQDYIQNGLPSGLGRLFKNDGSVHTGEFENGIANGKGVFIFPDGSYYEGNMKNNQADGDNGFFKSNQLEYRGGFSKNVFHGIGEEKGKQFHFKGDYKNGIRILGILTWKDESGDYKYEGHLDANGKFTGKGMLLMIKENFLTQMENIKAISFKAKKKDLGYIGTIIFTKI